MLFSLLYKFLSCLDSPCAVEEILWKPTAPFQHYCLSPCCQLGFQQYSCLQLGSSSEGKFQGSGTGEFGTGSLEDHRTATFSARADGKGEENGICAYRNNEARQVKAASPSHVYFSRSQVTSRFTYSECLRQCNPEILCELYTLFSELHLP